jgi:spermidine/putrescine transport system ATP-binding protein
MNKGRYEQLGDPEGLYERPRTRFVAGFLGISNLLPARIESRAGDYAVATLKDDTKVRVPGALADGDGPIEIGVRPEKIRLHTAETDVPGAANRLRGRIVDASYLGVSTSYIVEAGPAARLTVYEQNVERTEHGSLHRPGDTVQLSWSPDHTFVVRDPAASSPDSPPALAAPAAAGAA